MIRHGRGALVGALVGAVAGCWSLRSGAVARIEFDGIIQAGSGGGAAVLLPADSADVFGTRSRFPVKATFNGQAYCGSTMPMGDGTFCLGITKAIRAAAGVDIGDPVHVVIERDEGTRTVDVPDDLADALKGAGLADRFASMAYSHRKEYVQWIADAKRSQTRASRIEKAVAMIAELS
jgi:hypothetical protein